MRVSRVRISVWCAMALVAVVALVLSYLRRAHPVTTIVVRTKDESQLRYEIRPRWCDGRVQRIKAQCSKDQPNILSASEPWPKRWLYYGPVRRVEWSDGSASYYLTAYNLDECDAEPMSQRQG
jgi:hypothetical protein